MGVSHIGSSRTLLKFGDALQQTARGIDALESPHIDTSRSDLESFASCSHDAERERWLFHRESVEMPFGAVLYGSGATLAHIYFPTTAIVEVTSLKRRGVMISISAKVVHFGHARSGVANDQYYSSNGWDAWRTASRSAAKQFDATRAHAP